MTKDQDMLQTEDQEALVVVTDDKGNKTYYAEEMVIPIDNKSFALLVREPMDEEEAEALEEDDAVMIARIEFDTDGEPVYVDPTDEEFEAVKRPMKKSPRRWMKSKEQRTWPKSLYVSFWFFWQPLVALSTGTSTDSTAMLTLQQGHWSILPSRMA